MPQVNPDDGTSVVDDVIVTGQRRFEGYRVYPPFPPDDNDPGPVIPDTPEAPDAPNDLDEDCRRQAAVYRAALEAAERIGRDGDESGYALVRLPDGGIRAIGPIPSESDEGDDVPWRLNPSFYGLPDLSTVVGLVHNHPRRTATGTLLDGHRDEFSPADVNVTNRFLAAGASPDFVQFIVINSSAYMFDQSATAGSTGQPVNPLSCEGASLG